jgi:hypothetical protein
MVRILWLVMGVMVLLARTSQASDWQIDTVDSTGVGKFSSMKIDADGNAHLAYVADDGRESLRYAFWDHSVKRWFLMTVAERASFTSLVLDSKQRPHISYADAGSIIGSKLQYVRWDGTSWKKQTVPLSADMVAYYTSIALDANDNPSMSFYEVEGPRGSGFRVRMRVVTWTGKYWQLRTVDGQNQSGKFNALAIDTRGRTHLAYANVNATTAGARYAFWDGNSWNLESVDSREQNDMLYVGYGICIAVDKDGNPHMSYMNYSNPAVKYAVRKDGRWQTQVVDRLAGVGYPDRNSIVVDDQGRPYIAYYDAGAGMLKLAHREGQNWIAEVVDRNGCGFTSSLQVDHGVIWISYADEANNGLKVARRQISNPDPPTSSKPKENDPGSIQQTAR